MNLRAKKDNKFVVCIWGEEKWELRELANGRFIFWLGPIAHFAPTDIRSFIKWLSAFRLHVTKSCNPPPSERTQNLNGFNEVLCRSR